MHGTMGMGVLEQRREKMPREAGCKRLKKALQTARKRLADFRWAPTRVAGLLRRFIEAPKNAV